MNSTVAPPWIWHDGKIAAWHEATTHISELQWAGVGSVFEGLRSYYRDGVAHVFGLDAHLVRLARSMRMMRIEGVSIETLRQATVDVVRRNAARADEYIRIFVWFHEGWNYTTRQPVHAFVMSRPFPSRLAEDVTWSAFVSAWRRLDDVAMPLRAKAVANYQNSRVAGVEAEQRGLDFPILLNGHGEVAEGPRECVFLVREGALVTPPLHAGVLDSITRRAVILIASEIGVPVVERPILRSELFEAEEMFSAATASEVTPLVSIDGMPIADGTIGPITARVRRTYRSVVYGQTAFLSGMREAVELA